MVKPVPQEVGIVNKLEASQFALPRPKIPTRGAMFQALQVRMSVPDAYRNLWLLQIFSWP